MKIGYCLTGSFCTFSKSIKALESIVSAGHMVVPIMSENAYSTDTRFGKAVDFQNKLVEITGNSIIHTIDKAEPIGPQKMFDVLCIAPCTGNTLAKLALGITDTTVTMAAKSHLRNSRPVVIGVSTNDALGNSAKTTILFRSVWMTAIQSQNQWSVISRRFCLQSKRRRRELRSIKKYCDYYVEIS